MSLSQAERNAGGDRCPMVVYTAVLGGYDDPPSVCNPDPALDYVFFTDNPQVKVPPPWQVRAISPVFTDPQRDARRVKLLPHVFLPEYDVSVWVDANCQLLDLTSVTILQLLDDADIALPAHQDRACVFEEANAVLDLDLDFPDVVARQMSVYGAAGLPARHGLHATMFLVRRHSVPACRDFCTGWWEQVSRHSKRDQLSFDFIRWKSPAKVKTVPLSYLQNPVFQWSGTHKLSRRSHLPHAGAEAGALVSPDRNSTLAHPRAPLQVRMTMEQSLDRSRSQLATQGFTEPVKVFSDEECAWLLSGLDGDRNEPADWFKGRAITSRAFYDVAVDWRILSHVSATLGDDVILWGASLVRREPGQKHPWHADIESSLCLGRTVSVWIGLRGTRSETSLKVAPGSHRFGMMSQEVAWQKSKRRDEIEDEDIASWARERGSGDDPRLVPMQDGEALFFDGRLWHGSNNLSPELARTALLLQYAAADTAIRIPEFGLCEWPFRFLASPWPRCLLVKGKARAGINRISPPPMLDGASEALRLHSGVHDLSIAPGGGAEAAWRSQPGFRGFTASVADMSAHASVLLHGKCPHPPHQHPEEEILLVFAGEVDLVLPESSDPAQGEFRRLRAGEFVYYPAGFYHTLTCASREPAHYLMIKWLSDPSAESPPLEHGIFSTVDLPGGSTVCAEGWSQAVIFEQPTAYLNKLRCHTTCLDPGAGYAPHVDDYDVIIVVLTGEVETLGQRVGPRGVIFCAAGELHGMSNVGNGPARYLVFELHGGRMATLRLQHEGYPC